MAVRVARVMAIGALGKLRLRPLGSACSDCSSGCAGRCQLFAADEEIDLAFPQGQSLPGVGDTVRIVLDEAELRRAAWRGYGRALAGLLAGALAGHALGRSLGLPENLFAAIGLLLGTLAAVRFSKASVPAPILLPVDDNTSSS